MKRLPILFLLLLLCAAMPAQASVHPLIVSEDNPVPAIAKRVRPAVVQVLNFQTKDGTLNEECYGSGVYIDERGYIVTNYHVVEGADAVKITTLSGETIEAELVGTDDATDLAVLRVGADIGCETVPMGDSDALEIGELAIAIGCPGDSGSVLFGTVTCGIISGLDRQDISGTFTRSVSVIQTDAAINTGNSGGALLNRKGDLIGIPTLKIMADATSVYEGLGFAIPVNTVKRVITQLIENGAVRRPYLGVSVKNHSDESITGIMVLSVENGTPAAEAGLLPYDIITHLDSARVKTVTELTEGIDGRKLGETVTIDIVRAYDSVTGRPLAESSHHTLYLTLAARAEFP